MLSLNKKGEPLPLLDRVSPTLPNTADWFGRWRPVANQSNDYLIDREAQRTISYTGIDGVFPQDSAVTESMGDISDRTLENLAPSDRMIVMTRRRLLDAVASAAGQRHGPARVDDPEHQRQCALGRSDRARGSAVARSLRADARGGAAPGHGSRRRVIPNSPAR